MTKAAEIIKSPVTGNLVFKLNGEAVSKETFIATGIVQFIIHLGLTYGVAKAFGISKRKAYFLVGLANVWRELPNTKVDLD